MVNEQSIDKKLEERKRQNELDRKRIQVAIDHLKTLCFGCVGASVLTPMFKADGDWIVGLAGITGGGWLVIALSFFVLISMVICADYVR